jgi:4-amino-4-deoxy-L-arabinose transferase-like glycosyltransferase
MLERLSILIASPRRLALCAAAWLIGLAWIRPPAIPDEGRYTDIARWMLVGGDWLIPRLNGLPFIQKPPLYFWLEASGLALSNQLGVTGVLVYRWVSLSAALVTVYAVYRFVRARLDENAARWSAIVLVTSPFFFAVAQFASLDMLVNACITCTILFAVEAAETRDRSARHLWLAAYAAAALGILAKGLIGVVIPGMVFVLWTIFTRQPRLMLAAIQVRGLLLLALITVPWFVLVEQRMPGFLRFFFIHNHFERYAESGFNNPRGAWFYLVLVLGGTLPWAVALVPAIRSAFGSAFKRTDQVQRVAVLGLLASFFVVAFFTVPRSKLPGYVLPAVPALALVLGPWCATWKYRRPAVIVAMLLCIALIPAALRSKGLDPGRMASELRTEIAANDRVVFWRRNFLSVPLILQRTRPAEVVDDWSATSAQLEDSWRRELAEGREFEPARATGVLVTPAEFAAGLVTNPARIWVWVHKEDAVAAELTGFEIVARRGEYVVLRRPAR